MKYVEKQIEEIKKDLLDFDEKQLLCFIGSELVDMNMNLIEIKTYLEVKYKEESTKWFGILKPLKNYLSQEEKIQ